MEGSRGARTVRERERETVAEPDASGRAAAGRTGNGQHAGGGAPGARGYHLNGSDHCEKDPTNPACKGAVQRFAAVRSKSAQVTLDVLTGVKVTCSTLEYGA